MSKTPRTRRDPAARREELMRVGHDMFVNKSFDEVSMEDVAKAAGVSAGLVYHYFGSKRAFAMEIVQYKANTLFELTEPDPDSPPVERLFKSLGKYIDFVEEHRYAFLNIYRSPDAPAPEVRAIAADAFVAHSNRMLDALRAEAGEPTEQQRLAVHGGIMCVKELCLNWLEDPKIDKAELRDLCAQSFLAILAAADWEASGPDGEPG
ncbi:MAG: TetR/AcrR family transcriptional regulator [Segniliparus sp.]|uniref:TetR/AcrR family transcriptional regulator n=1 Tax=Segniliparus sp. TaxID=2804064 RepID=UPI003F2B0190